MLMVSTSAAGSGGDVCVKNLILIAFLQLDLK